MGTAGNSDLTTILRRVADGDPAARSELFDRAYRELHDQAARLMRNQVPSHTLQPTALVHETFLRLARAQGSAWADRTHFLAVAARAMRSVLVDHARGKGRAKRGGDRAAVPLDRLQLAVEERGIDPLVLDEALRDLAGRDERAARVVELRFFGGLTMPEIAEHLGVATRTVEREWELARAWLYGRM